MEALYTLTLILTLGNDVTLESLVTGLSADGCITISAVQMLERPNVQLICVAEKGQS